ncbi:phosphonate ABC transporter ATP-binding protein [Arhodomonas sp. SL1]|uniref:phosphonate ABC transporter ATP-binding protein n=1 Tax=Arhodomonas sp. SL1 TaxID=3425691 RepID=UPI003F880467
MLEIQNLTKRYRTGDLALDDVSIEVPSGQVMGLIGPSGAGKSTLIRCVNRLVEPSRGNIRLAGIELTRLGRTELRRARRRLGMIFQEYALVERLTVMENVLSGQLGYVGFWRSYFRRFPPETIRRAYQVLERVGLMGQADKRADALSGGQRVGIARALLQEPDLLLVDEPTASLDPRTARQIMRLLREVCAERGLAAVVNIHDVHLARRFMQRIVGLRAGRVVFDGDPQRLDPAALTDIYGEEDWGSATEAEEGEGAHPRGGLARARRNVRGARRHALLLAAHDPGYPVGVRRRCPRPGRRHRLAHVPADLGLHE